MLSKNSALLLLLFQIFNALQCEGTVPPANGRNNHVDQGTNLETSNVPILPDHEDSRMFLLPPSCNNNMHNLKNSLRRFKRATLTEIPDSKSAHSETDHQAKPGADSLSFVGTHECDVLVAVDLAFARQAIARYKKNHSRESDPELRSKLKPQQWMDPLWRKDKKMLQAYINEVFEKINGLFARTDFNDVRLRFVPTVMTLDNFCASKHSSMLCSDDFIMDTSQAVIEISSIPEIKEQQSPCVILFLASKSKKPPAPRGLDSFWEMIAELSMPFNEMAEAARTFAPIPSKFSEYSGGLCDNRTKKNARRNISYIENHGIDDRVNFVNNDILEDVLLYRMLAHVLGHSAGSHHDEDYVLVGDPCYNFRARPTLMSNTVHSLNANVLKTVQESFNDCTKKFVSDHLEKLQAGKTPKPKTCLKTNIEIKRAKVEGKKFIFVHAKKSPVVTDIKLPLEKKQIETLVLELGKSYPFEQSVSQYGKARKLVKPRKSADLKSVWDLVQNAVDAGFSIQAKDPKIERRLASSVNPEHSVEGVKTAFYYWHTVHALKEFGDNKVSDRLSALKKRIESDCVFLREEMENGHPALKVV